MLNSSGHIKVKECYSVYSYSTDKLFTHALIHSQYVPWTEYQHTSAANVTSDLFMSITHCTGTFVSLSEADVHLLEHVHSRFG